MECPACGLRELNYEFVEKHSVEYKAESLSYSIFRCLDCNTEFSDPMKPAPPEWYAHIGEVYGWRWEFDEFISDLDNDSNRWKVLEIGCGEGLVLERLQGKYDVCGIDFNTYAINVATSRGVEAYSMTVDKFIGEFPDRKFDVIALFQVIEHLDRPIEFLNRIRSILKKDGRIFISTPNPLRTSLIGKRESWDYPPHHLTRFTEDGISSLLKNAGFTVIRTKSQPLDFDSYNLSILYANRLLGNTFKIDMSRLIKYQRVLLKLPVVAILYPIFMMTHRFIKIRTTGMGFYITARCAGAKDR